MQTSKSSATASIANVAAYKFVALDDLPHRRQELRRLGNQLRLKGTVLLSREGINRQAHITMREFGVEAATRGTSDSLDRANTV